MTAIISVLVMLVVQEHATVQAVPVPWPAIAALLFFLLTNTAALFYWGGSVRQMLRDHDRRIAVLEDRSPERRVRPRP